MSAEHVAPLGKALLRGILIKARCVRPREAKAFAPGHTALQHSRVPLALEPRPPGTVPEGQVSAAGCGAASDGLGCRLQMESFSWKPV